LAALIAANNGSRISKVWDNYNIFSLNLGLGNLPVRFRFKKDGGQPTADKVWSLQTFFRRSGIGPDGHGYTVDHWELRFYPRSQQQLAEAGGEKIYVLDFAHCGKKEDMSFSRQPFKLWRLEGTERRGALYGYNPADGGEMKVFISPIETEIIASFPVRVEAVGIEPIVGPANSTLFLKYKVEGAECLYDRRTRNRNGSGWLEVVKTTKGDQSWVYCNLKELQEPLPDDAAVLVASDGKLAIIKDGEVYSPMASAIGEYV
jgi:hypothetical protein